MSDAVSDVVADDYRVRHAVHGVRVWLSLAVVRIAPDRFTLTITDVSRTAKDEETVDRRESELQSLFASIDEGFCICQLIVDDSGKAVDYLFESVNPLFEEMTGLVDPVGRTALQLIPDLEAEWVEAYSRVALLGETLRFEQGSDAMGRWFDIFAMPVGTDRRFAIVFKDQTSKRATEVALRETSRVNAFRAELVDAMRVANDDVTVQGRAATLLGHLLGASRVFYLEFDAAGTEGFVLSEFSDAEAPSLTGTHRVDFFGPEVLDALRAGNPVAITDAATDPRLDENRAAIAALRIAACAIAPVIRSGRPVAALSVHHREPHTWSNDELTLIDEVAQRTHAALDVVRSEAAQRRRHVRADLVAQLLADLELDSSLERQAQRICDVLTGTSTDARLAAFCDFATIEVPVASEPLLALAHVDPDMIETLRTLREVYRLDPIAANSVSRAAAGETQLLANINPAIRSEYTTTSEMARLLEELGPRSHMAVPLDLGGGVRSALMVGITDAGRDRFASDDLEFLKTTAARVGVVIAASKLRRQEHAVSHRLQRALLPSELVRSPRLALAAQYRSASTYMEVGGDWYDTFAWPNGHVGLLVGDVVGHNLESAATMGYLRAGMAALAPNLESSPAVLLDALQQCARAPGGTDFLTAAFVIIDTNSGKLTYSLAGHPPLFLVHSDGFVEVLNHALTPPLCAIDVTPRPEATLTLAPGDTLVMYTDGLIERRSTHPDVGLNALREALVSAHELPLDRLIHHLIENLTTDSTTDDDVVVVCARYTADSSDEVHSLPISRLTKG